MDTRWPVAVKYKSLNFGKWLWSYATNRESRSCKNRPDSESYSGANSSHLLFRSSDKQWVPGIGKTAAWWSFQLPELIFSLQEYIRIMPVPTVPQKCRSLPPVLKLHSLCTQPVRYLRWTSVETSLKGRIYDSLIRLKLYTSYTLNTYLYKYVLYKCLMCI